MWIGVMSGTLKLCRFEPNWAAKDETGAFGNGAPDREKADKAAAARAKRAGLRVIEGDEPESKGSPHRQPDLDRSAARPISLPITSIEEYEAATSRAQALLRALKGVAEKAELAEIMDAIAAWDQRHDDATRWG